MTADTTQPDASDRRYRFFRTIFEHGLSDIECKIKPNAKDPPTTQKLGDARPDVVRMISKRAADYLAHADFDHLRGKSRQLMLHKLYYDISSAITLAEPEEGFTQAHLDVAKQIIPAMLHQPTHYRRYLNAYTQLCDDVHADLELKNPIMASPALAHDTALIDDRLYNRTIARSGLDMAMNSDHGLHPLAETRMRLDRLLDDVKANRKSLFPTVKKDRTYHTRAEVDRKIAALETLKERLMKEAAKELEGTTMEAQSTVHVITDDEAAEAETVGLAATRARAHSKLYARAHEWQIPPTGYADMFLSAIQNATDYQIPPQLLEETFIDGSDYRNQIRDLVIKDQKKDQSMPGYTPPEMNLKYTTALMGMHPDDIERARNYARTFTISRIELGPDPLPSDEDVKADAEAQYHVQTTLIKALLQIKAGAAHKPIPGAPELTFGSMAEHSEELRGAIKHFCSRVTGMLRESPLKTMHVNAATFTCARIIADLRYTAKRQTHPTIQPPAAIAPAPKLTSPSEIVEFLDEIGKNIADRHNEYGSFIRAYAVLARDIKDPIMLDGNYMVPEETCYLDPDGNPIEPLLSAEAVPQDATADMRGDLNSRQKHRLLASGINLDDYPLTIGGPAKTEPHAERPHEHEPEEGEEEQPVETLYHQLIHAPIPCPPMRELTTRLAALTKHVREHAPALFNVDPQRITPDSEVSRKLDALEQFAQTIIKKAEGERKGVARDKKTGRFISRKHLFDPYWSVTVEGYCSIFMQGLNRAVTTLPADTLHALLTDPEALDVMHEGEAKEMVSKRANPEYEEPDRTCIPISRSRLLDARFNPVSKEAGEGDDDEGVKRPAGRNLQ